MEDNLLTINNLFLLFLDLSGPEIWKLFYFSFFLIYKFHFKVILQNQHKTSLDQKRNIQRLFTKQLHFPFLNPVAFWSLKMSHLHIIFFLSLLKKKCWKSVYGKCKHLLESEVLWSPDSLQKNNKIKMSILVCGLKKEDKIKESETWRTVSQT